MNKPKKCEICGKQMKKLGRNIYRCPACLNVLRRCDKCGEFNCICREEE